MLTTIQQIEKDYDEMIAPLTDSTADIKAFLRSAIIKVLEGEIEEMRDMMVEETGTIKIVYGSGETDEVKAESNRQTFYNSALTTLINNKKALIKELKGE